MSKDIVRQWMRDQVKQLRADCEDDEEVIDYLVEDANEECGTDYEDSDLQKIAESVLEEDDDFEDEDLGDDDVEDPSILPGYRISPI